MEWKNLPFSIPCMVLAALAGCGGGSAHLPEAEVFSGYYAYGFEESLFAPIGKNERWWLLKAPPCVKAVASPSNSTPILYLEVKGNLSPKGAYGHLGQYSRELDPKEFLVCRTLAKDENPNF
jgi:hypothetical protein